MTRSSYVWQASLESETAEGHDQAGLPTRTRLWRHNAATGLLDAKTPPIMAVPNAAASLYTTAADYARFVVELLGAPRKDAAGPSGASLGAMFRPVSKVNEEL